MATCLPCAWTGAQAGISGRPLPPLLATGLASCQMLSKEVPQSHKYAEKHVLSGLPVVGGGGMRPAASPLGTHHNLPPEMYPH